MKKYVACQMLEVDGEHKLHYAFIANTREYFTPPMFGLRSDYQDLIDKYNSRSVDDTSTPPKLPMVLIDSILEVEDEVEIVDGKIYIGDNLRKVKKEKTINEKISTLQSYLTSTDWYAVRYADTGEPIPEEVKEKRKAARVEISELRELLNS